MFLFSLLFEPSLMSLENAFWVVCGVFATVGLIEAPTLTQLYPMQCTWYVQCLT